MDLLLYPLLFFASFGAMAVLIGSATAAAIWTVLSFLCAMFGFPRALRELRTQSRDRRAIQADLNRLKRAGA